MALAAELDSARRDEQAARAALAETQAERGALERRLAALAGEQTEWEARIARARQALGEQGERQAKLEAEAARLAGIPGELGLAIRRVEGEVEAAEAADRDLRDTLSRQEAAAREADHAARNAFSAHAEAREALARNETLRDHAAHAEAQVRSEIESRIDGPATRLAETLAEAGEALPTDADGIERRLFDLKAERDRLGGVNLQAETELAEIGGERDRLAAEREELIEAIRRFRRAIDQLNSEGRARLRGAFDAVNAHFGALFERLFGGGTAELTLVEAEDPLEAGLEIVARPPGKKPQLLSLLSGGEQALTATALIFAVFRTNPSPICVLDEVDAPLDDSNVERLCDLLVDMARETRTRFLVITHNPITMARMDRLFGVTMVERGVSQLVSVDLAGAERLALAG